VDDQGYFLHVLASRRQQALGFDFQYTSESGITVPVQLFAVGETPFHRFLAAAVNSLAPDFIAMIIYCFLAVLPNVTGYYFDHVPTLSALASQLAITTYLGI